MPFRSAAAVATVAMALGFPAAHHAAAQERRPTDVLAGLSVPVRLAAAPVEDLRERFGLAPYKRPEPSTVLRSLYVATAASQALDVHSTLFALGRGASEANPLMRGLTGREAAFVALKAGVAVSTIAAARKMSRRNRAAAIVTLVAINSAYAAVISHNYRVARRLR